MLEKQLTLKQLGYLLAIEQTRSFRRAAEFANVSQPSLSVQIQNLEALLGVQLVERSRSGVALTPIGREVALRAQEILDAVQGVLDLAAGAQNGLVGTIRLGASPTLGPYLLPYVVASLHKRHKSLKLYIRERAARDLEYDLSCGVHDLIVTQLPSTYADTSPINYSVSRSIWPWRSTIHWRRKTRSPWIRSADLIF